MTRPEQQSGEQYYVFVKPGIYRGPMTVIAGSQELAYDLEILEGETLEVTNYGRYGDAGHHAFVQSV